MRARGSRSASADAQPQRHQQQPRRRPQRRERGHVRERGLARVGDPRPGARAQHVPGAEPLRHEPRRGHQQRERREQRPRARVAPPRHRARRAPRTATPPPAAARTRRPAPAPRAAARRASTPRAPSAPAITSGASPPARRLQREPARQRHAHHGKRPRPGGRRASRREPVGEPRARSPAAARTSTTHSTGAALPSGASSAQTATGSGLKAGPATVLSDPPATSRPHSSQVHGS